MYRLLLWPTLVGLLTFSIIYWGLPEISSESRIVAFGGQLVLDLSNALFTTTPSFIASYLAGLNLLTVALTAGIAVMLLVMILISIRMTLAFLVSFATRLFKFKPEKDTRQDLPAIDIDPEMKASKKEKFIFSKGFDPIDRQ